MVGLEVTTVAMLASFLAGAAWAQTPAPADPPVNLRPTWIKTPSSNDLNAVFPAEARRKGQDGRAVIACLVTVEGTLAGCEIVGETPPGLGYGYAALALAPQFRMKPATENGRPIASRVRFPITFKTGGKIPTTRTRVPSAGADAVLYVTRPIWVAAPSRAQVAAAYPPSLKTTSSTGQAQLDCGVGAAGQVEDCRIVSESPAGQGVGRAAVQLARALRTEPPKAADGSAVRGARARIPVAFSPTVLTNGADQIARPEWGRLPEGDQVSASFPGLARAAGLKKGEAVLACTVKAGGGLSGCTVARETPAGMGFGAAALALAPSFAMSAWTSDGRPVDGATVRIPIRYEE